MTNSTTTDAPSGAGGTWKVFTEDWDPAYGNPATFDWDDSDDVEKVESETQPIKGEVAGSMPIAFIDGCRRAELSLWVEHSTSGVRIPGLAGAYAVGAVTVRPGRSAEYSGIRVGRIAVWGGGHSGDISSPIGYIWASDSTTCTDPDQLLAHLQDRMRLAEGNLALDAAAHGWYTLLDGPLNRIPNQHGLVTGYVKSHRRQLLPAADHALVPQLALGYRTPLYTNGANHYTCYIRVGHPGPGGSPWTGIARLHFPALAGVDAVIERANHLTGTLPSFAGVAHRDPRAPVNLTPVKNLENHLTRSLGRADHARRAARDAIIAGAQP